MLSLTNSQKIENRLEKTIIIRSTKAVRSIRADYFHRILVCPIWNIGILGTGKVIFLEMFERILNVFMNIKSALIGVQLQLNMVSTRLQLSEGEMADSKAGQGWTMA